MTLGFVNAFISAKLKHRYDCGDFTDQLNYSWTPMMMMVLGLTLFASQYVGQPIQCWVPAQFTGAWERYAETYCFIKNTYFWPLENLHIPQDYSDRDSREIGYYQWVPIVLCLQALMFWFPSMFWRLANKRAGLHVKELMTAAGKSRKSVASGGRQAAAMLASDKIGDTFLMEHELAQQNQKRASPYGLYLTALYLFTKVLYVTNVVLQFFIINQFLGTSYSMYGYGVLNDLAHGRQWNESGHFPRVTFCDFTVRVLGNLHRHTLQCVLMINMFNEKIYVFLWWWFVVVGVATVLNLIYWLITMLVAGQRRSFVQRYLRVRGCIDQLPSPRTQHFVDQFLDEIVRPDGTLLLRIIQVNGGDLLVGETVENLWNKYIEAYHKKTDSIEKVPLTTEM